MKRKRTVDCGTVDTPWAINKDGITLRGAILFLHSRSGSQSPLRRWGRVIAFAINFPPLNRGGPKGGGGG